MVIGTTWQMTSFGITQLAIARVVTDIGYNTATLPAWQSGCSPAHMRGKLIMVEGALITGGIMVYRTGLTLRSTGLKPRMPTTRVRAWRVAILHFKLPSVSRPWPSPLSYPTVLIGSCFEGGKGKLKLCSRR